MEETSKNKRERGRLALSARQNASCANKAFPYMLDFLAELLTNSPLPINCYLCPRLPHASEIQGSNARLYPRVHYPIKLAKLAKWREGVERICLLLRIIQDQPKPRHAPALRPRQPRSLGPNRGATLFT